MSINTRKRTIILLGILSLLAFLWLIFSPWGVARYHRLNKKLQDLERENRELVESNRELRRAIAMIRDGYFSPEEPDRYRPLIDTILEQGDPYMILADYEAYVACDDRAGALYLDPPSWNRAAILNTARMGFFSTDRTVSEYAEKIWNLPKK